MKYTKEQRFEIGRRIYNCEIDCHQAAEQYNINHYTARDYMRMYRDTNQLPNKIKTNSNNSSISTTLTPNNQAHLQEYQDMSKEELSKALIQARITEARLKKGYEVKGDGSIIQYSNKNTK